MKEGNECHETFMKNIMNEDESRDTMQYDREIKIISRWLARGDRFLAEELRNEMHIAIMTMEPNPDVRFCIRVAKCRAIDYLRSKARNYSYGGRIKHVSLEAMRDAGFQIDTMGNVYAPYNDNTADINDGSEYKDEDNKKEDTKKEGKINDTEPN